MERQPLGRARTDAGEPLKLINQPGQRSGEAAQRFSAGAVNLGASGQRENGWQASGVGPADALSPRAAPMPSPSRLSRPHRLASAAAAATALARQVGRNALAALMVVGLMGGLASCSAAAAGLQSFQSPDGRYAFLYPTGWNRVQVSSGPQVVFHDLINSDETLSLVISDVNTINDLTDLGGAQAVGERLKQVVIAPEGSGREAELVDAQERQLGNRTFYDLEYNVHLADRNRHELATVVVDRGRLYTFAASTNDVRWPKVRELFQRVITSFNLLI